MKKICLFTICLTSLLCLLNCGKKESYNSCHHNSLKIIDSIKINLDSLSPNNWGLALYEKEGDTSKLFIQNVVNSSLDIYALKHGKLIKRIKFLKDGPNSITHLQGFVPISSDSFLVFDRMRLDNALLYGSKTGFTNLIRSPLEFRTKEGIINHVSQSIAITEKRGNNFEFVLWPLVDYNDWEALLNFEWLLSFNNETQTLSRQKPIFPSIFKERKYWGGYGMRFSRVMNEDNNKVYSWGISDSIQVETDNSDSFSANASFCKIFEKFVGHKEPIYMSDYNKEYIYTLFYTGLFYDPYKKLYHRIGLLPYEGKATKFNDQTYYGKRVGIITLNEHFEIIGETFLKGGIYDIHGAFITPEGFCIPFNNILNQQIDENKVSIHIFDFLDS